MASLIVRNMQAEDEHFVGTCTHVNESEQVNCNARLRIAWLREKEKDGLRVKVALQDGAHKGFLYVMPIEIAPGEPMGMDLMSIPCLFVSYHPTGSGIGRALLVEAEKEACAQGRGGLTLIGFYNDFWFMPAQFFEKHGFSAIERQGERAILWKVWSGRPPKPTFFQPSFAAALLPGKVVLDLFWMSFCGAMDREVVAEVAREFGDAVVVREHCTDDRQVLLRHQINRGLFVNGARTDWDFANPSQGVRVAIQEALASA